PRPLRRVGAGAGPLQVLRLHGGERRRRGAKSSREVTPSAADWDPCAGFTLSSNYLRHHMTIKVGINGFGRIGRMVFRAAVYNFSDIEIVGINDLLEPDYLAYMLKYDSVHGPFKGSVAVQGNMLVVNGKKIRLTAVKDPAELKWGEIGADIVVESTGLFLTKDTCQKHLAAGAKKVIMSAP